MEGSTATIALEEELVGELEERISASEELLEIALEELLWTVREELLRMYPSELVGIDSLELLWVKLETPFGRVDEELLWTVREELLRMHPSELVGIDSQELLWEKLETPFGRVDEELLWRMLEEESEKSLWLGALVFSSQAIKKSSRPIHSTTDFFSKSIGPPIFLMNDRKMVKKVYRKPRSVRNGGRSQWMVMYDVKKQKLRFDHESELYAVGQT